VDVNAFFSPLFSLHLLYTCAGWLIGYRTEEDQG
jgi:hypothetical protein